MKLTTRHVGMVRLLRLLWFISLLFGEFFSFYFACMWCSWQEERHRGSQTLAVIADPQLTDYFSYDQDEGSLGLWLTEYFSDRFMRRAYRSLDFILQPTKTLLLGDLFDGGRVLNDRQFEEHMERLELIFKSPIPRDNLLVVVGNHDIGLGRYSHSSRVSRFRDRFGPLNYVVRFAGVSLVIVDSITLAGKRQISQDLSSFVSMIEKKIPDSEPRILFSHIPLYRAEECQGNLRYDPRPIRSGEGVSYQNILSQKDTKFLLDYVRPNLILSGDDHDYCRVHHRVGQDEVIEETIGTFSWCQGNFHPSFALLTISQRESETPLIRTTICFLPPQIYIFMVYLLLGVLSFLAIGFSFSLLWNKVYLWLDGRLLGITQMAFFSFGLSSLDGEEKYSPSRQSEGLIFWKLVFHVLYYVGIVYFSLLILESLFLS